MTFESKVPIRVALGFRRECLWRQLRLLSTIFTIHTDLPTTLAGSTTVSLPRTATQTRSTFMTTVDGSGRPMGRVSPRTHLDGQAELPSSSYILTKAHILDAIARSTDNGCTLDLSNRNLTDVGETGAEELAQVGRDGDLVDECRILRCVLPRTHFVKKSHHRTQNCTRRQLLALST